MPDIAVEAVWPPAELLSKAVGGPVREVVVAPLGAGDNFASAAFRVKVVTATGQEQHLFVKRPPDVQVDEFFPVRAAFAVEARMYRDVVPRMAELLRSIGRDSPPLAARMLLALPEPAPALFFDDISVQGFRMAGRGGGLDEAHCRLVLRALARWHAAGAVLLEEQPNLCDGMPRMVCEAHHHLVDGLLVKGLDRLVRHAEKWPSAVAQSAVAKLKRLQPTSRQRVLDGYRPAPLGKGFNTVLHGDLWSANTLYKYAKDGKPEEVRLVDFQISTWGSPTSDIMYFFASAAGEVRARRDELLAEYYAELAACLRGLGARHVPDLAELKADLRQRGFVEVITTASNTPIVMAPASVGIQFEHLIDLHSGAGPHPRDLAIDREEVRHVMEQFFAAWEREGLLDELLQQRQYQ